MKTFIKVIVGIACLLVVAGMFIGGFFSGKSSSVFQKRATGWPYEVLVVMNDNQWKQPVGQLLKSELTASIEGLLDREARMRVTQVGHDKFDGMLRYMRNILVVKIDSTFYTKVSLKREQNRWALGQEVLSLNSPNTQLLEDYLSAHETVITDYFEKQERNRYLAYLKDNHSSMVSKKLEQRFNIDLEVSEEMCSYKDTTDFFWTTNHGLKGRTDFVVYSFPYQGESDITRENLIAKRDSILRKNIPGAYPNSYMTTTKLAPASFSIKTFGLLTFGVLRGLWEMEGDMMGGPFVAHAYKDEDRQRIVVAETFIYAPNTYKGKLIRRAEAALYTFRFL